MQIQKVFKAGNSDVVAIPKSISSDLGLKSGQKVVVEKIPNENAFVVKKIEKVSKAKKDIDGEFERWWDSFLAENKEILDELAVR